MKIAILHHLSSFHDDVDYDGFMVFVVVCADPRHQNPVAGLYAVHFAGQIHVMVVPAAGTFVVHMLALAAVAVARTGDWRRSVLFVPKGPACGRIYQLAPAVKLLLRFAVVRPMLRLPFLPFALPVSFAVSLPVPALVPPPCHRQGDFGVVAHRAAYRVILIRDRGGEIVGDKAHIALYDGGIRGNGRMKISKTLKFKSQGWEDYLYRQTQDKKTLKRINRLIQDILTAVNTRVSASLSR